MRLFGLRELFKVFKNKLRNYYYSLEFFFLNPPRLKRVRDLRFGILRDNLSREGKGLFKSGKKLFVIENLYLKIFLIKNIKINYKK